MRTQPQRRTRDRVRPVRRIRYLRRITHAHLLRLIIRSVRVRRQQVSSQVQGQRL
jgi:hypothetical protein